MKETAKSLGEFVASVLSTISGATYIPATVLVGGAWLAGVLLTAESGATPVEAVVAAPAPNFPQLAVFVVVTMIVAAVLEPVQFWLTRLAEGHLPIPVVGDWLLRRKVTAYRERNERRIIAGELMEHTGPADVPLHPRFLATSRADNRAALQLPSRERLVAFRLGNLIRRYEDDANDELRENGTIHLGNGEIQDLLPYASFAIPEITRAQHAYFRSQLQCMVTLMLAVPLATIAVAVAAWDPAWTPSLFVAGALVTAACVSGSRSAADGYGTMLLAIARQYTTGAIDLREQEVVDVASAAGQSSTTSSAPS